MLVYSRLKVLAVDGAGHPADIGRMGVNPRSSKVYKFSRTLAVYVKSSFSSVKLPASAVSESLKNCLVK